MFHRTHPDLIVRDERTAGRARIGFVRRRGTSDPLSIVDEFTLDLLRALRTPQDEHGLPAAVAGMLARHGQPLRPDQQTSVTGLILDTLQQRGWTEPTGEDDTRRAQLIGPTDPTGSRPGWVPLSGPLDVVLSVTMACNLRCKHCGVSCGPDTARPDELTLAEIQALFDEFTRMGVREVTLTGGEITIRDDWHQILEATVRQSFSVLMISNGVRLSEADVDLLAHITRVKQEGFRVAVSLDGATPASHGFIRGGPVTFERSTANIARLTARGVDVSVGMTVSPTSAQDLPAMLDLAARLRLTSVEFHPVEIYGRAVEHSELFMPRHEVRRQMRVAQALRGPAREKGIHLLYEVKRVPFTRETLAAHGVNAEGPMFRALDYPAWAHDAGLVKICVDADGAVYPSEKAQGYRPLILGTIRDGGLQRVWDSGTLDFFRGGWTPDDLHQCRGCPITDRCATRNNRIIPHVALGDPLAAMPECQRLSERWSAHRPVSLVMV